ncbi:MAG: ribonuclease HII [Spirochaeta sp.]|jgi:ribonuclease HII|nr:ribonuclease HII [Spirochaeta sp.]
MQHPNTETLKCGIDEVGRGPLAGPVTAAAVILPPHFDCSILADSKKLSASRRAWVELQLREHGVRFGLGWVENDEIDRLNIHNATLLAMQRAFAELRATGADGAIDVTVDGRFCPPGLPSCRALVGADATIPEVMAASILAKNARDDRMVQYAAQDDRYGFEQHKGYPTAAHRLALRTHGPCAIHRRSFRGVVPIAAVSDRQDTQ